MNHSDQAWQHDDSATPRGAHLADLRAANRACILTALERAGPLSRSALARLVGLSRTTVGSIVGELLREGRLREVGHSPISDAGGRPGVLLVRSDDQIHHR